MEYQNIVRSVWGPKFILQTPILHRNFDFQSSPTREELGRPARLTLYSRLSFNAAYIWTITHGASRK
ncbi:hypothetical protein ABKN59_005959 [Abortiporus biennis]